MATSGDNGAFSARSGNDASASMLVTRVNLGEARLNGAALADPRACRVCRQATE